jgi:hypothetical protein
MSSCSIARRVVICLLCSYLVVCVLLLQRDMVHQRRDWQERKAARHAWIDAEHQAWQRKVIAREADDAAYRDTARRCACRLSGKSEDTPYDEAFVGLSQAEKFVCFPFRRIRLTADY